MPDGEIALPTVEELRAKDAEILPPEKRALLPPEPANSGLPASFLSRLPSILHKEHGQQSLRPRDAAPAKVRLFRLRLSVCLSPSAAPAALAAQLGSWTGPP